MDGSVLKLVVRMILLYVLLFLLTPNSGHGYPSFVSYGYKSCVTCHFNPQGNGPLNDYGRALFASEISSRYFANPKVTDEELGERSGFFGLKTLPQWLRPHLKARLMALRENPGGPADKITLIPMQLDAGTALVFDSQSRFVMVATAGYMPTPRALQNAEAERKPSNFISREFYLRWNPDKRLFISAGLMDKVFGIRTVDHTAFSREKTGLGMNDQAHGLAIQVMTKNWELTVNPFVGNISQEEDLRQKGASVMFEKDYIDKARIGASVLSSKNSYLGLNRLALHGKIGYGEKNSFLIETGGIHNRPNNGDPTLGVYALIENVGNFARGYNVLSQFEYFNQTGSSKSPDQLRWTLGLLMFPMPRYEIRTTIVNSRIQSDSGVSEDQWMMQAQLHLSM